VGRQCRPSGRKGHEAGPTSHDREPLDAITERAVHFRSRFPAALLGTMGARTAETARRRDVDQPYGFL
jgi:hypothetical protein